MLFNLEGWFSERQAPRKKTQKPGMVNTETLKSDIKSLMVKNLMLQITPEEIGDDQLLFGPGSLGLDSVDALQLVVALDKDYGLKIANPEAAREVLKNVDSIVEALRKHLDSR